MYFKCGHVEIVARSDIEELKSLESFDIEEETEVEELSDIPSWRSEHGGKVLVNIDSFGAAGDGESDDTEVTSFIIVVEIFIIYQVLQMHNTIFYSSVLLKKHFHSFDNVEQRQILLLS